MKSPLAVTISFSFFFAVGDSPLRGGDDMKWYPEVVVDSQEEFDRFRPRFDRLTEFKDVLVNADPRFSRAAFIELAGSYVAVLVERRSDDSEKSLKIFSVISRFDDLDSPNPVFLTVLPMKDGAKCKRVWVPPIYLQTHTVRRQFVLPSGVLVKEHRPGDVLMNVDILNDMELGEPEMLEVLVVKRGEPSAKDRNLARLLVNVVE